ncbi:MAG TPA: site-2 protease family protein, partial [Thermomicrobiales bacterium]|nr:site-2 protease family protein [Thermomicrobiales bacterium]
MPLGGFGLLSLFYIFLGLRFLMQFIPRRKEIFDNTFTPYDRSMLGQAAFFVLLPLSVALHELGHAVCIWLMGGKVLDFGFYFFSGYVSYDPRGFSELQRTLIAFAGTFVNLVLIVIALAVVFLKKPPLRAPWNELLLQFVFISGINALIFYPAMDVLLGMSGDWTQMYQSGIPWLTAIIVITQVGFIAVGWWGWKNPGVRARIAKLTGQPQGASMRIGFGGGQQNPRSARVDPATLSGNEKTVSGAMNRVAAGWSPKPSMRMDRGQGSSVTSMIWQSNDADR